MGRDTGMRAKTVACLERVVSFVAPDSFELDRGPADAVDLALLKTVTPDDIRLALQLREARASSVLADLQALENTPLISTPRLAREVRAQREQLQLEAIRLDKNRRALEGLFAAIAP